MTICDKCIALALSCKTIIIENVVRNYVRFRYTSKRL